MDTIIDAYKNSDAFGKFIVDVLLAGSTIIWCIIIMKICTCRSVRHACKVVINRMKEFGTSQHFMLGELVRTEKYSGPLKAMAEAAVKTINSILMPTEQQKIAFLTVGTLPRPLTDEELERIQVAMDTECNAQQRQMEEWLPIMSAIISLAPMLGLLGTVWGVMLTFINMVKSGGRPDIESIGPGISGALLTTVGGLLVAIPAMGVNYLIVSDIQKTDKDMEDFESMILASLRLASAALANQKQSTTPAPQPVATIAYQSTPAVPQQAAPSAYQTAPVAQLPGAQSPFQSAPVAQQPAVQSPFQSAPVAQQPVAQSPFQSAPVAPQPAAQSPFQSAPVAPQPAAQGAFQSAPVSSPSSSMPFYRSPNNTNSGE